MKNNRINIIITIICFSLSFGLCIYLIVHNNKGELSDALRFKKQFEDVNNAESPYTNEKYIQLKIDEDNPFVYKSAKEIVDILNNETAIIFMGYPESDLTRTVLPLFLETLRDNDIEVVYYLDIFSIRDAYQYAGSIMPKLIHEGTDAYYKIVDFLKEYLDEYYVSDSDGNRYDTLVKRVNTPTIVTVSDGEVMDYHFGAVIYHNEENFELNELEQTKLKEIYQKMLTDYKKKNEVCNVNGGC